MYHETLNLKIGIGNKIFSLAYIYKSLTLFNHSRPIENKLNKIMADSAKINLIWITLLKKSICKYTNIYNKIFKNQIELLELGYLEMGHVEVPVITLLNLFTRSWVWFPPNEQLISFFKKKKKSTTKNFWTNLQARVGQRHRLLVLSNRSYGHAY